MHFFFNIPSSIILDILCAENPLTNLHRHFHSIHLRFDAYVYSHLASMPLQIQRESESWNMPSGRETAEPSTPPEQTSFVWKLGNIPVPPSFNTCAEDSVSFEELEVLRTNPTRNFPRPTKEISAQQSPAPMVSQKRRPRKLLPAISFVRNRHRVHSETSPNVRRRKRKHKAVTPSYGRKRRTNPQSMRTKKQKTSEKQSISSGHVKTRRTELKPKDNKHRTNDTDETHESKPVRPCHLR